MKPILMLTMLFLQAWPVFGQIKPSGASPSLSASLGYSYVNASWPASDRVGLSGADAVFTWEFSPRLGLSADLGYVRRANIVGSDHHADMLSYMLGPVVKIYHRGGTTMSAQVLGGGSRVTGQSVQGDAKAVGYVNQLAWGVGGIVEYQFSRRLALRGGVDFIHSAFFSPALRITGLDNIRAVLGATYDFNPRRR
jgi:hypothetical protein